MKFYKTHVRKAMYNLYGPIDVRKVLKKLDRQIER